MTMLTSHWKHFARIRLKEMTISIKLSHNFAYSIISAVASFHKLQMRKSHEGLNFKRNARRLSKVALWLDRRA